MSSGTLPLRLPPAAEPVSPGRATAGARSAFRAERRKLASQLSTRVLALVCLLGPFVFTAVLKAQSGSPADTLFGVWVHSSGLAVSLVVLGFAGSWGFPVLAGVLAGDIFAAEDRYGTWKTLLTRSCSRRDVFRGKLAAAALFALGLAALTAASSLVAGILIIGAHPLVSLSGTRLSAGHALVLVLLAWVISAVPMLAFTALALLLSAASRNGIVGVIGPALAALVMQLLLFVGSGVWAHMLLISAAFDSWHAVFVAHPFFGPLAAGMIVSALWTVAALTMAWRLVKHRDFAGVPVSSRRGWAGPVRVVLGLAVAIAGLALATNAGPAGVTAARLTASITPTFSRLTLLQQRELGRAVPPGAHLNIKPACARRASTRTGPGDWVCTLTVYVPQPGAVPFQPTPVTYDVSVQSNGCYKAESPPSFVGQQTMRDAAGRNVVNPLFTIYGCFNPL